MAQKNNTSRDHNILNFEEIEKTLIISDERFKKLHRDCSHLSFAYKKFWNEIFTHWPYLIGFTVFLCFFNGSFIIQAIIVGLVIGSFPITFKTYDYERGCLERVLYEDPDVNRFVLEKIKKDGNFYSHKSLLTDKERQIIEEYNEAKRIRERWEQHQKYEEEYAKSRQIYEEYMKTFRIITPEDRLKENLERQKKEREKFFNERSAEARGEKKQDVEYEVVEGVEICEGPAELKFSVNHGFNNENVIDVEEWEIM